MVENALFADPRLLDCAVVGIPDKRLGELVCALVVPRKEWLGKLTEEEILAKVKPRSVIIDRSCRGVGRGVPAMVEGDLICILRLAGFPHSPCHP
jgi:acyl-CoA synthetase (AMP-forming)/AMP-acid ligase II